MEVIRRDLQASVLATPAPPDRTSVATVRRSRRLRVVLLCHYGRTGYNILRALNGIGAKTFLIHDARSASLRFSRSCKVVHATSHIGDADPATVAELINDLHKRHGIDTVMAGDVESLTFLAQIRNRLLPPVFPVADPETLARLDNKWEFYKLCQAIGVPVPKTLFFPSRASIDPDIVDRELGFPVVLKPAALYGQRGIEVIADRATLQADSSNHDLYDHKGLVIQEYVEGRDWALSVFARHGVVEHWTAWLCPGQLDRNYGVGRFMATEFHGREDLLEMGRNIVAATGFSGVANFDARLDSRSYTMKLFECNPRFFNRMLAARLCGLDFVRAGLPHSGTQRPSLAEGQYYSWHELFSARGMRRLLAGEWRLAPVLQDVFEMFCDPLPPLMRKVLREDAQE